MSGKFLQIVCLFLGASLAHSAAIPFAEASKHIGQEATVTGKVSGVHTIASGMTFLNFGARGEAGAFTAVARAGILDADALKAFEGKDVEVTGKVELYKGSPQIVLKTAEAIRLAGEAPAEAAETPEMTEPEKPAAAGYEASAFEVELEREEIRAAGKTSSGFVPTKTGVAIAVPADFKAGADMKVLAVFPDFSGENDLGKLIAPYAAVACPKGWLVLAAHSPSPLNQMPPGWFAAMYQAAFRHLGAKYPGIAEAPLYLAGSSIGAGRATLGFGALVKEGYDVGGCFLTSLKWDEFGKSIQAFDPSKSKVKRAKMFVSHGAKDFMVTKAESAKAAESILNAGVKELRQDNHEGQGGVDATSLAKALEWFAEPE